VGIIDKIFGGDSGAVNRAVRVERAEIKSILVIRMNRAGDMICTMPLIRTLRQEYPEARLSVLAESTNADIVEHSTFIDKVYVYQRRAGLLQNRFLEVRKILKGARFDLCIGVKAGFSSGLAIMTFLSNAKYRVGYVSEDFHPANMLYNVPAKKSAEKKHQILQCLDLLCAAGITPDRFITDCAIDLPDSSEKRFGHFLAMNSSLSAGDKIVVVNISNNKPASTWHVNNFISLVEGLGEKNVRSVITSVPADRGRADDIVKACPSYAAHYDTPCIPDFAASVKKADLLICHDSGSMHIGAATGTRTLVLVGRGITPEIWGPYGAGHKCIVKDSVASISTDDVIRDALSILRLTDG
jgi:ADP-heptose:LPS heptosyltransferase